MMHPDRSYQLSQIRHHELLMVAEQARTTQELIRTRRLVQNKEKPTMLKLTIRYARYILSTLAAVGFGL